MIIIVVAKFTLQMSKLVHYISIRQGEAMKKILFVILGLLLILSAVSCTMSFGIKKAESNNSFVAGKLS